jgi:hypothetical protein
MNAELAKIKAELDARLNGGVQAKPTGTPDTVDWEGSDGTENSSHASEDKCVEDSEAPSEELCSAVYKTALAAGMLELPRGVTQRSSGKWQVQLYFAGCSRYLGLFECREDAAAAYETARECRDSFKDDIQSTDPEQVKSKLELIRKAAFGGSGYKNWRPSVRTGKRKAESDPKSQKVKRKCPGSKLTSKSRSKPNEKSRNGMQKPNVEDNGEINLSVSTLQNATQSPWALMEEEVEETSRKRKYTSEIYEKAKALAAQLPRGITVRPSGKWQVQLYYAGKSRYIGVFDSKLDAAVAYELARECCIKFKDDETSPEQAKQNVILMRNAAFSFTKDDKKKKKTSSGDKSKKRGSSFSSTTPL